MFQCIVLVSCCTLKFTSSSYSCNKIYQFQAGKSVVDYEFDYFNGGKVLGKKMSQDFLLLTSRQNVVRVQFH